jgi:glycosyltransferase involved in cell wall biosynthesis
MTAKPKISVIIPTYNRASVLPRSIASVLAQDEPDFELIIVDDCSTDDTRTYVATLVDARIRLVPSDRNVGTAAARNLGLSAGRADVVALLDDDDTYLPRRLSAPLAILANHSDVVCTLSSSIKLNFEAHRTLSNARLEALVTSPGVGPVLRSDWRRGTSITARRAAAVEVGGFNPGVRWSEDR